jgi:hypothetical protein
MSAYNPPIENVPIFDSGLFRNTDTTLTQAKADTLYLKYPIGQGNETIPSVIVNGASTLSGVVDCGDNIIMSGTPLVNYLEFPDGSQQFSAVSATPTAQDITSSSQTINTTTGVAFISATDGGCALGASTINGTAKSLIGTIATSATGYTNTWISTGATSPVINSILYLGNNLFLIGGEQLLTLYNQSTKAFTSVATLASGEYIQNISPAWGNFVALSGSFTNIGGSTMNNIALYNYTTFAFSLPTQAVAGSFLTLTQPVYCATYWSKTNCLYIGGAFTIYPTSTSPYFTAWNFTTNAWDTNWGFATAPAFRATAPITCIDAYVSSNDGNTNYIWSQLLIGGFGFGSSINMCWASGTGTGTALCRMSYSGQLLRFGPSAPSYDICSVKNLSFGSNQIYAIYGYGMFGIGKFGSGLNNTSTSRYTTSGISPASNSSLASYFSLNPTNATISNLPYNIFSTSAGGFVNQIAYQSGAIYFAGGFTNYSGTGTIIQNPCYTSLNQSSTTPPAIITAGIGGAINTAGTANGLTNSIATDATSTAYGILIGGYFQKSGYTSVPATITASINLAYAKAPISTTYPFITASFYYQGVAYTAYRFSKNGDTINVVWNTTNNVWYIVNPSVIGTLVA